MNKIISKILKFKLSVEDLAKKSGLSEERVSKLVNEDIEPTLHDIRRIAAALNVRIDFLLNDVSEQEKELNVLFRKVAYNNQIELDKISYTVNNFLSIIDNVDFNKSGLDKFAIVDNSYVGAKLLAENFRKLLLNGDFVSPILDLPYLVAEKLNCILLVYELGAKVDGASAIKNNIPIAIISPRFIPRMLFTLAHELGHILLHHRENGDYAIVDNDVLKRPTSSFNEEAFAHTFASELLMPQEGVSSTLKTIRTHFDLPTNQFGEIEIHYLSRIYGVSFEAAALRCESLGLIQQGAGSSIYESISREYKNPENRARQLNLPPRPEMHFPKISSNVLRPAIKKVTDGELSIEKAAQLLSISISDFVDLNSEFEWK